MDQHDHRDLEAMSRQVGRPVEWVRSMLVDRSGAGPEAHMVTTGLHAVLGQDRVHRCAGLDGLSPLAPAPDGSVPGPRPVDPAAEIGRRAHDRPPPHRRLRAQWGAGPRTGTESGANLLGESVVLEIDDDRTDLSVPLIDGDAEHLLYYGALPIATPSALIVAGPTFPVWTVDYGSRYVDGYLLSEPGGGFYLEWHTDRPHWHQPLSADAAGFYLLARQVSQPVDGTADYHLTAFRLRPGTAVYTRAGAIHCDGALTGTWAVGYADAKHFSTALLRNRDGAMVKIEATDQFGPIG